MDGFTAFPERGPHRDAARMEGNKPMESTKPRSGF